MARREVVTAGEAVARLQGAKVLGVEFSTGWPAAQSHVAIRLDDGTEGGVTLYADAPTVYVNEEVTV